MIEWPTVIDALESGDWESAHRIVQQHESEHACWAHGIVHLMEGDEGNAAYWYRRAGRVLPPPSGQRIATEIAELRERVSR